jgi:hypothetical protein
MLLFCPSNNIKPISILGVHRNTKNDLRAVSSMERSTPAKPIPKRPLQPKPVE